MNRKMRCTLTMMFAILALAWTVAVAPAQPYELGDLGKPADYDLTLKVFRDNVPDFASFVDQLPTSFSWKAQGKVTPAKDQQNCGGCWAFASAGAFESKLRMKGKPVYDLSEQQQISCNTDMAGCGGGNLSALRFWETVGPMLESCTGYPSHDGSEPACSTLSKCTRLPYRTVNYYTVETSSRNEIKTSLYTDGPAYFRFDVYSDFGSWWGSAGSGAVYRHRSGSAQGGHAVLVIGWNDSKGAWLLKNSWGKNSGPNGDGTFWMAYTGHAVDLNFGMANIEIKENKAPLKRKKLMFLRRALSSGPFDMGIYNPPTKIGGDIGAALASDTDIGKNALDAAAGDYGSKNGDELVLLTKSTTTLPNKLFLYNMPTAPNGNTGAAWAGAGNIGKNLTYVTSGDFDGDGKEEVAVVRRNPTTRQFQLYIYRMPTTVGGKATLIASDLNIGTGIMGIAAGNYNTDAKDELFVIAGNANKAGIYIYEAPTGGIKGDTGSPIASDTDIGSGVITRGLAAGNFDGNANNIEVAIVRKMDTGALQLQIYRSPAGVNGDIGSPIASDNSIDKKFIGVAAVDFAGSSGGFTEDFNDGKAQNWVDDQTGVWSVGGGVYKMTGSSPSAGVFRYSTYNKDFSDFTYEVDVRRTRGSLFSSQGMIFRSDSSYTNGYVFQLSANGYYLIYKLIGGSYNLLISDWTHSSALKTGFNVWNKLKVVTKGTKLEFYANGTKLQTIYDTSFSSGKVGLNAYDVYDDINVNHFDNAKLVMSASLPPDEIPTEDIVPGVSFPASPEAAAVCNQR